MTIGLRFLLRALARMSFAWAALLILPLDSQQPPVQHTSATSAYPTPQTTTEDVLHEMTTRAGIIFLGTVLAVRLPDPSANTPPGIVEVEFSVEQAVLGPATGTTYTVREWAGLWQDGPRFLPGQRRLMLLHAPGPGGLSSPVDGLDGAIPVTGGPPTLSAAPRAVSGPKSRVSAAGSAAAPTPAEVSRVDLRWLTAKALRSTEYSDSDSASNPNAPPHALTRVPRGFAPASRLTSSASPTTTADDPQPELGQVLSLLTTWQAARNVSR